MRLLKFFLTAALVITVNITAHSQNYMDIIVEKSCDCVNQIPDTLNKTQYLMQLGTCMINAAMPYKKKIKADYGINMDDMDEGIGEKLGRIIGIKMVGKCPSTLLKVSQKTNEEESNIPVSTADAPETKEFVGTVSLIEDSPFVVFSVKDDLGKSVKFYWLSFAQCESDLPAMYNTLLNKTVKISYTTSEFFDPKIGEYRQYNIISAINTFQ